MNMVNIWDLVLTGGGGYFNHKSKCDFFVF